ncbi:SRPBCC family protein [Aurantiacibacter gangjinensis]|uniref:Uncharacterized protein n=1 Tax=Aurantiacibacter gangjinensis TaxID=502682 RepID=A0A0G9MTC8_9SPHN|nr:SRPBCC domain-containing protein [Aurantiacibacter gangjinensis]APE28340.1 hypothetical protein BMF35_a1511 [Aurantiacibacter gangjinensis]KLE32578.1 hypothetical protein AAW01_00430 [Aurantiacibacter gangjinensis]
MKYAIAAISALAAASSARAEVVESNASGFVTQDEVVIEAAPSEVWQALVEPGRWWNGAHSWSGDAGNFSVTAEAGGCFCEALPGGGSVEHMRVVYAAPDRMLRLSGALGPLQTEALGGSLTIELEETDDGTRVSWTYVVGGYSRFPLEQIAPAVDAVQSEQLRRLHALLSTGDPEAQVVENAPAG